MACGFLKTIAEFSQSRDPAYCPKCKAQRIFRFRPAKSDTVLNELYARRAEDQTEFKRQLSAHNLANDEERLSAWRDRNRDTALAIQCEIERICAEESPCNATCSGV